MSQTIISNSNFLANANELIKTMEELKINKELLKTQILEDEEEKKKIENELSLLAERLEKTNGNFLLKKSKFSE